MASSKDFVQYIADQCSGAGEIAFRKMMGDYCIYCDGVLFGTVCDDNLFVKPTAEGERVLREVVRRPPYEGAKDYLLVCDVDDRDYLAEVVRATLAGLPRPKAGGNPMKS